MIKSRFNKVLCRDASNDLFLLRLRFVIMENNGNVSAFTSFGHDIPLSDVERWLND